MTESRALECRAVACAALMTLMGCTTAGMPRGTTQLERPPGTRAPDWGAKVAPFELRPGLLDLYLDRAPGKLWAVLPAASGRRGTIGTYLYVEGITTGVGSNPIGLDRGQIGETRLLALRRVGSRVLFEAENTRFRALSADAAEVAAVRESFATSILWATEIVGEDTSGRLLVDLSGFALRDAHGVVARLTDAGQGSFSLDSGRSAIDLDACLAFPQNIELESTLTFAGSRPGSEIQAVAPDPEAITLVLHQSLLALPDDGYRPREHDPRMGSFAIEFADFAAPLARPLERRWIVRQRLERVDATSAAGAVKEPIVYYVDRSAPEPIRSALLEGARWWAGAFEAAGFVDAYRVELLPEGAHPLDARYNVVQWVHRATRGWSYGGGVIDPRTGEMLKGHVSLDSLRIRQDRILFEGLAGVAKTGSGAPDDPIQLALARIRQLAAHEVGHTLGLAHNFAASTYDRASVMDYPAPLVEVGENDSLDFSHAYASGIGAWDETAIRWAYSEFPPGADERTELEKIVREALARDQLFLTDSDARSPASAHPRGSLWDNGADPVAALTRTLQVRRIALARFGEENVAVGTPLARLEETLATVYLHHRFQLVAAAKVIGGLEYSHAVRGDGQAEAKVVSGDRQRRALAAVLDTLAPSVLDLPEKVLRRLLPRAPELATSREQFGSRTAPVFDALGAAASAADLTLRVLLDPSRAARLVDFHRRSPATPDLSELLNRTIERIFVDATLLPMREAELARVVQRVLVDRLIDLSGNAGAGPWVRARVDLAVADLLQRIDLIEPVEEIERSHLAALAAEIGRHLSRPSPPREPGRAALPEPPGEPIGGAWGELDSADGCAFDPSL